MNEYEFLESRIEKDLLNKLSNIKFYYKGFHNYTFKVDYERKTCQLRVPISNLVDHQVESLFMDKLPGVYYYKKGVLVRKWFEGKTLEKVNLTLKVQKAVIDKIKEFHKIEIDLPAIDLFYYGKGSKKYQTYVEKYNNDASLVTCHCDLNLKNILINEKNEVELIDFEWVRKANPLFDAMSLIHMNFDSNLVKKEFKISQNRYKEALYVCNEFSRMSYEHIYKDLLLDENKTQLHEGYTNLSYVKNDLFIQKKQKNGFNHLNKLEKFSNLGITENVIYEDDEVIVRHFINKIPIDFQNSHIRLKIAQKLATLHSSKIKLIKNQIAKRIKFYYNANKDHELFNKTFSTEVKSKILEAAKLLKNEIPSHNDLNRENFLLANNNEIMFIDFEYSSQNSKYFDIAYHCSDLDYSVDDEKMFINEYLKHTKFDFDYDDYYATKAIVCLYGISWSLTYNPDFDFTWLVKHVLNNINYVDKFLQKYCKTGK
ncbi:phosphotransferase [Mycoplasmopsis agalactiae]|nr:phosphotransferase [Mycoplasmopsis agalactiae]MCE6056473.1 phosphotransferase [Mycoplasmopsis agalactiae]